MKVVARRLFVSCLIAYGTVGRAANADSPTAEQFDFFEARIRPALADHCYSCHSEKAVIIKGGLLLDTRDGARKGGENGPAIVPGDVGKSLLIRAIRYHDKDTAMPPRRDGKGGKLPDAMIADFEKWITMGAPDPRDGAVKVVKKADTEEGRKWWSFQPMKPHAVPQPLDVAWPRTDIDRFILTALERQKLTPAPDADRATLLRRAAFDLTGLPPSEEMMAAFVSRTDGNDGTNDSDTAHESHLTWEEIVDGLLQSPRFGERWGRHWLDVARYAETSGKAVNVPYANAWRYRDYVIAAFNADKPYDHFIKEQIAGDLLPYTNEADQAQKIIATGFLALGPKTHDELDEARFFMDVADEQIDTVTQAMLGLTVACARCHDHKNDPVSQRDYYALAGIFLSSEPLYGTAYRLQNWHNTPLIEFSPKAGLPSALSAISPAEVAALDTKLVEARRAMISAATNPATTRYENQSARVTASFAKAERDLYLNDGTPRSLVIGVLDRERPTDSRLLIRGEVSQPGEIVPRGFVRVLSSAEVAPIKKGSGRLQFAEFIASPQNPLTARVMVNRVWSLLFGRGIVATPDDFGRMGDLPSHPEVLDHLALDFIANGWSVKKLIRKIMLSRVYQQSSAHDVRSDEIDSDNQLLWRMSRRRLDAEAIRDAMLALSGRLDLQPPAGSIIAHVADARTGSADLAAQVESAGLTHRSVYLPIVRGQPPSSLACFDFADPSAVCGRRNTTNVPAQSLYLMNNAFVLAQADAFAARIAESGGTTEARAERAFTLALSRRPVPGEREAIRAFIQSFPVQAKNGGTSAVFSAFCQSLFACGEFRYLN